MNCFRKDYDKLKEKNGLPGKYVANQPKPLQSLKNRETAVIAKLRNVIIGIQSFWPECFFVRWNIFNSDGTSLIFRFVSTRIDSDT